MNLTRLMALGTLARHGQMHGHQIRRQAEITNVGEWGGVSVGALYRELRSMEGEHLIEAVRTEQMGRRPARTVYSITGEGHLELASLRVQAVRNIEFGPDPLGVALTFAFTLDDDRDELMDLLLARGERLAVSARELAAERERGIAAGYLTPLDAAAMHRGILHIRAEVAWHEDVDKILENRDIT